MDHVIAIVQPYELMSVAEQKYVLAEYARDAGITIDHFVGEDEILGGGGPCLDMLEKAILTGDIAEILLLDGVAARLPRSLSESCERGGCRIHLVDSRKGLRLAG